MRRIGLLRMLEWRRTGDSQRLTRRKLRENGEDKSGRESMKTIPAAVAAAALLVSGAGCGRGEME
jgi:hypothetical protein